MWEEPGERHQLDLWERFDTVWLHFPFTRSVLSLHHSLGRESGSHNLAGPPRQSGEAAGADEGEEGGAENGQPLRQVSSGSKLCFRDLERHPGTSEEAAAGHWNNSEEFPAGVWRQRWANELATTGESWLSEISLAPKSIFFKTPLMGSSRKAKLTMVNRSQKSGCSSVGTAISWEEA